MDAGLRGAVTGGGHLDAVREVLARLFEAEGFQPSEIFRTAGVALPGYYRPAKKWDLVVVRDEHLVGAIELKSQVGPSFGNNVNNRTEEAIGNAADVWRAFEEGTFGSWRPWLGYVFVLEDAPASTRPVGLPRTVIPTEAVFDRTSYADRYRILCDRLVKERLYDAAWFVMTSRDAGRPVWEPDPGLGFSRFAAAIAGRAAFIRAATATE